MRKNKYGIEQHVAWLMLAPLLVMVIGLEAYFLHDRFADMNRGLLMRGQLITHQLAASSEYGVFSNNQTFLNHTAESVLQQPDVRAVIIMNSASEILVAAGAVPRALGAGASLSAIRPEPLLGLVNAEMRTLDQAGTVLLYQPILSTQVALDEIETPPAIHAAGAVIVEMSWDQTNKLKSSLFWFTTFATAGLLVITLYLIHLASRRIVGPIRELSKAVHAIGNGELDTRVAETSRIKELCTLTRGINQMTADLQNERAILQHRIDEATKQLRDLAFYDTLTQLPNRRLLEDRLTQAFFVSKRNGCYGALMFLDLDKFKPLNDQFGHVVGDLLLVEVAHRIRGCMREMDTVARFGGDEFVVLLSELSADRMEALKQAHILAEKIRSALEATYYLIDSSSGSGERRIEHRCAASIGVAMFRDGEGSEEDAMRWADTAMYQAKQEGRNRVCFHEPAPAI
ncbi:MAG TPA: diguanylate cyclase [Gallionella sp.]|nr:diguanylate cyclase [Gallionella sp.]